MKDILPFKNPKDFTKKITESKDFRIKVQKLDSYPNISDGKIPIFLLRHPEDHILLN